MPCRKLVGTILCEDDKWKIINEQQNKCKIHNVHDGKQW